MALCRDCRTVIPCHCHLSPPVQIRPGVYLVTEPHPEIGTEDVDKAATAVNDGLAQLFQRLGPPSGDAAGK